MSYVVFLAPDGCAVEYIGTYQTLDDALAACDSEPRGTPQYMWDTARASGNPVDGCDYPPDVMLDADGVAEGPVEWVGNYAIQLSADHDARTPAEIVSEIESGGQDVTPEIVALLRAAGTWTIDTDDDDPDDMGPVSSMIQRLDDNSGALWVVSTHRLLLDGTEVAMWTRCAVGRYGGNGGPGTRPDGWDVSEDTEGGDRLHDEMAALLDALGLEDDIPAVPEPDVPSESIEPDPDGEYAVYWYTVGDDAHEVARYATQDDAQAIRDELDRGLRSTHPGGRLLCGYEVLQLDAEGEWRPVDE